MYCKVEYRRYISILHDLLLCDLRIAHSSLDDIKNMWEVGNHEACHCRNGCCHATFDISIRTTWGSCNDRWLQQEPNCSSRPRWNSTSLSVLLIMVESYFVTFRDS